MVEGRYEFTGETKIEFGIKLHRIRALVAIAAFGVAAGELGGWIEKQENLSQVSGDAWVSGDARVSGDAWVSGPILVASRSDGYIFLVTPTKIEGEIVIIAGCRYFTPTQAREHWTKTRGGTKLGEESIAIVGFLEWMAQAQGWIK